MLREVLGHIGPAELGDARLGPGLDPRVKDKLFLQNVTTKPNGHGFGLTVCRKIIQNHKGEMAVESQPGQGTQFVLSFPLP